MFCQKFFTKIVTLGIILSLGAPIMSVASITKEALLTERVGFASAATGGLSGKAYVVTSLADSGPGTLRAALESTNPAWVTFRVSGVIELQSPIRVRSHKTVDGRGQEVIVTGHGLRLYDVENVIVSHIAIVDGATTATDAIEIARSDRVWINRVTLANFPDGLLDIKRSPSTGSRVSVTRSRFSDHNKVSLVGLSAVEAEYDSLLQVTFAYNYFADNTIQRHPRVAQGYVHLLHNVITWDQSGVASYDTARVLSEANWYLAPAHDARAVRAVHGGRVGEYEIQPGYIRSLNDVLVDAYLEERGAQHVCSPQYAYTSSEPTQQLQSAVMMDAGSGWVYNPT